MLQENPGLRWAYPIDLARVAPPAPRGSPGIRDKIAVPRDQSTCPACRSCRRVDDWEHTCELGQCSCPWDTAFIPECQARIDRKPRLGPERSLEQGKCIWAAAPYRNKSSVRFETEGPLFRRLRQNQQPAELPTDAVSSLGPMKRRPSRMRMSREPLRLA
jgi:hypothetical protein